MQHDAFGFHRLSHSAKLVNDDLRKRLAPLGIRPNQALILDALGVWETASQSELAQKFNVTAASMSTMTVRLINAGFVQREVDPNEIRSNILRLTDEGKNLLEEIHTFWREMDAMIEETIGPEKAKQLMALSGELRDKLGGHAPKKRGT